MRLEHGETPKVDGGSGSTGEGLKKHKWKLAYLLYKENQNILGRGNGMFEDCQLFSLFQM